ncbi:MAG: beta-propeller fold lactonase family protein [Pseudomonadota bacterium]
MTTSNHTRLAASGLLLSAMALTLSACGGGGGDSAPSAPPVPVPPLANQLYTETNDTANAVVHMVRNADGSITVVNRVLSGGAGLNGVEAGTSNAPGPDSVFSQHSVIVSPDHTTLFAVNAGDGSVSVFAIDQSNGDLTLKKTTKTAGSTPTSLAFNNGVLYVMFQTGGNQLGSYTVQADGGLTQVGLYPLPPGAMKPTQIVISPDNNFLVASSGPMSNTVASYPVGGDGTLGTPVLNNTATSSLVTPFAGIFASPTLYLETDIGAKGLASYTFSQTGALSRIGAAVIGETAPCWLALTPDRRFVFVGNGSGAISSLSLGADGSLALINAKAASEPSAIEGVPSVAADSFLSADGKYLYAAYLGDDKVVSYRIGADGGLTKLNEQAIGTATKLSMQGLAGI